jgi:hypothetical protein
MTVLFLVFLRKHENGHKTDKTQYICRCGTKAKAHRIIVSNEGRKHKSGYVKGKVLVRQRG